MKVEKSFVVGFTTKGKICWFVRHPELNDGDPFPVQLGDLESVLKEKRSEILKARKKK